MYRWERLPDDQVGPLLYAYRLNDYVNVLTILNRHNIAPDVLTLCCGLNQAWEQIEIRTNNEGWTT